MSSIADKIFPPEPDTSGRLTRALRHVRWSVIGVLFLLSFAKPLPSRAMLPMWEIILLFAGYNLVIDLLRSRVAWLSSFSRVAFLDLPVTALVYWLGIDISGPLFSVLVLGLFSAVTSTKLRGSIIYTVAVAVIVIAVAPTFPFWYPDAQGFRELAARLLVIGVVSASATAIMRQLWLKDEEAASKHNEARQLEESDRIRSEFISTVSHDLGTPLTASRAVLGLLEGSAASRLTQEERELLDIARRNNERLGLALNDLLSFNKLEADTLQLECMPMDLRSVVADSLPAVQPLIRQKRQVLELDLPEALWTEGDPRQLGQTVVNLLANAHHHTPPGTRILVSGERTNAEVVLSVADDGPGLVPAQREVIFERFHYLQAEGGGSGLGLAIAKAIVELHGGRISVAESPRGGADFRVVLARYEHGEG